VLPSPAGYCDERDVICDKSMLRCEDQRIGMPIFRADLLQMDHNGSFGSIQNGPLPPKWASPGTGLSQTGQGGQMETPAEREGTAGVPGNRALSSGKRDGGAATGTYNHTHSEKMTKKLCTDLFGLVLQLYNPGPSQCPISHSD
jgi:hypothetical protein